MDNLPDPQQSIDGQPSFFAKFKLFFTKNKFIIIPIVCLSIISFGVTGYLLLLNKKPTLPNKLPQENIIPTLSPTPSNTPSPFIIMPTVIPTDPTATWSAFVSSAYSYSIKYPPGWTAQAIAQADPKILEYAVFNPVATKAGTLSITLSYGTRTYLEALALDPQVGETIRVASVSSTKKNSKDSNGYKATNIIVPSGSNTIVFNAKDAYIDLFNQMLSTLKLTK
ncbi:MAG: hypothetical protein HW400_527 [Candidatus Levybacteria bacterium]|nr:hypothetical protein [Candidatus Levybacteria bacterium]